MHKCTFIISYDLDCVTEGTQSLPDRTAKCTDSCLNVSVTGFPSDSRMD